MTPEQIALVQQSYAEIAPFRDHAGEMIYTRLFVLDPMARNLFTRDIASQARHFMLAVETAVRGLNDPVPLLRMVRKLGQQHAAYGVTAEQIGLGGTALLWTLDDALGAAFTPELRDAWAAAYALISGAMLQGLADAAPITAKAA